jgi:hypothetical protein
MELEYFNNKNDYTSININIRCNRSIAIKI